jgi:hypothetical protein
LGGVGGALTGKCEGWISGNGSVVESGDEAKDAVGGGRCRGSGVVDDGIDLVWGSVGGDDEGGVLEGDVAAEDAGDAGNVGDVDDVGDTGGTELDTEQDREWESLKPGSCDTNENTLLRVILS